MMAFQLEQSGRLKKLTDEELAATEGDAVIVVYSTGVTAEGYPYWLYIGVKPSKYRKYMEKIARREALNFPEYGEILRYGYEESVPEDIRIEMEREHGCSEHYMEDVIKELKAEQVAFLNKKEDTRINDIVAMLKKKQPTS